MEKDSPASSTPGQWVRGPTEEEMEEDRTVPSPVMNSELTDGDQSTILGASDVGDCSTTAQWDPCMEEETILQDTNTTEPGEPIALRTRSHDGSMFSRSSQAMMDLTIDLQTEIGQARRQKEERERGPIVITSMDGSYSMEADKEDLEKGNITVAQWQGGYALDIEESMNLLKHLEKLEKAKDRLDGIFYDEDVEKSLQDFKNLSISRQKITEETKVPERYKEEKTGEVLGLTYIKQTAEMSTNLGCTIKALREVLEVNLHKLPLDTLEKLLRMVILYCIELQEKMQEDGSLLEQMDTELFDMAGAHEKMRALHKYTLDLLSQLKEEKTRNVTLSVELERVREERLVESTPGSTETKFLKAELKKVGDENSGLITKLKSLKSQIDLKNSQLDIEDRKYKKLEKAYELEKQKDKDPTTLQAERDRKHKRDMKVLKEDYERQIKESEEEIKKLNNVAQARINDNRKIYEQNTSKDKDIETLQARVLIIEKELKKKNKEMDTYKADLNTSRQAIKQKEGNYVESITVWQNECSRLQSQTNTLFSNQYYIT